MSSFTSNIWYETINAVTATTATCQGPNALQQMHQSYHQLQNDTTTTTLILQARLQWAKSTTYLRLNSDPIPNGILPKSWKGIVHEIKVNPRGYGKKKGPPTDDAVYEGEEKVRRLVPRGCCYVELFINRTETETDTETNSTSNNSENKRTTKHIILPGIFAMKKFSGGLGDEDDDRGQDQTSDQTSHQTTTESLQFESDRWSKFFTRPYTEASLIVSAKKANGEAAHVSCIRLPNNQLLTICGSKHVHLCFVSDQPEQISLYKTEQKYGLASIVAETFVRSKANTNNFLTFMADTGVTSVFEIEQPTSMHVELFDFDTPRLKFLAFTECEIGTMTGDIENLKKSVNNTTTTTSSNTAASVGQCLPPVYGYEIASLFGLSPVSYQIYEMSKQDTLIRGIRKRYGDEGDVLYFMKNNGETIGLVKVKTVWYVVSRAIREKLRTMIGKATKIQKNLPVKGFWNAKQGLIDVRKGKEKSQENEEQKKGMGETKEEKTNSKKKNKRSKKNRGTKYKPSPPPSKEELYLKLCERTVHQVGTRVIQLQKWLKFSQDTLEKYDVIAKSFISWSMARFIKGTLCTADIQSIYPVVWLQHIQEMKLNDRFVVELMCEKVDAVGDDDDDEEDDEEEILSKALEEKDFNIITINNELNIKITTRVAATHFQSLFEDAWTGSHIWDCSLFLCRFLHQVVLVDKIQNKTIIELGAGVGLVSIACCLLGAAKVIATDQKMMVDTMVANRNANHINETQLVVASLVWNEIEEFNCANENENNYDVILVSDCLNPVYGEDNCKDLAHVLSFIMNRTNAQMTCYIAYEERCGEELKEGHLSLYELMFSLLKGSYVSECMLTDGMKTIYCIKKKL